MNDFIRQGTVLGFVMLMGCTVDFNSNEDSATDTAGDSTVDTSMDTGEDTPFDTLPDTVPDTSFDTAPDTAVDTMADTAVDTLVDPEPDGPDCLPVVGGECNVIEQCGCPWGHFCGWVVNETTCDLWEICEPGSGGTGHPEGSCSDDSECPPGTVCLSGMSGANYCLEWCRDETDCTIAGRECISSINIYGSPTCGEVTPSLNLCSTGDCEDEGCIPLDHTTCIDGETCAWDKLCDIMYCTPHGTAGPEDPCADELCGWGMMCMQMMDGTPRCIQFCNTDTDCSITDRTCQPFGGVGSVLMVCLP